MSIPKVYLDTSVISHLEQTDAPDKMKETHLFWKAVIANKFDMFLSDLTIDEISECQEPKRSELFSHLRQIKYTRLSLTEEVEALANKVIEYKILTPKSYDDCLHIACAVISGCDYIASWNFKHIVNVKTINGIRAINMLAGYRQIEIVAPPMLINGDDLNE